MVSGDCGHGRPTRLVLFHGLASSPKEFGFLAHPLRRHGVQLQALEVEGYSAGRLGPRADWRDWVDQASLALERTVAEAPGPYVLGGLCTGAMLALAVAARRPPPGLAGLALLSPLFAYDGWGLPRWYGLRRIAYLTGLTRWFAMSERPPYGLKNERMRHWIRQQLVGGETSLVGPARVPLAFVRESERLSHEARAWLPHCPLPVMAQHAREDEICSLASVQASLARLPQAQLTMHVLENSYHMITADNDRHRVADQLIGFMRTLHAPARALVVDSPATAAVPLSLLASGPAIVPLT